MCVVQKPEEQYKVMLQVGLPGRGGEGRGASPGGEGPMEGPEGPEWRRLRKHFRPPSLGRRVLVSVGTRHRCGGGWESLRGDRGMGRIPEALD